jgi:hypothetical protein
MGLTYERLSSLSALPRDIAPSESGAAFTHELPTAETVNYLCPHC